MQGLGGNRRFTKRFEERFGAAKKELHRSQVVVSEDALVENYRSIQKLLPEQAVLPMVKANAYGHGMQWAGKILSRLPHLYGLGVATLEEGRELREAIGVKGRKVRILVFSGAQPWTQAKGEFCESFGLTPILASDEAWKSFFRQGWCSRLRYELKFNTGMNRLGLSFGIAGSLAQTLKKLAPEDRPQGILSHLAMGESPRAKLTQLQVGRMRELRSIFESAAPGAHFHLANSSGIWNAKDLGLDGLTDVVRTGLALYGVVPWAGAPLRGIRPVLKYNLEVLQIHELKAGDSVGYGATFRVPQGTGKSRVAILGGGYADGVTRFISNRGAMTWQGARCPVLGRVSMDLCAVHAPAGLAVGDWVEWLGSSTDLWKLAEDAGTIPYEVLTSISPRVERSFE